MAVAEQGQVKYWDPYKRHGLIQPGAGGKPIYFHERGLVDFRMVPRKGMLVTFQTAIDRTHQPVAVRVRAAAPPSAPATGNVS